MSEIWHRLRLRLPGWDRKCDAAMELFPRYQSQCVAAIAPGLGHRDERVRARVARTLGEIGHVSAVRPLLEALVREKKSSATFWPLLDSLGQLKAHGALPHLKKMLASKKLRHRDFMRVVHTWYEIGEAIPVDLLTPPEKNHPNQKVQIDKMQAFGKSRNPEAVKYLIPFLGPTKGQYDDLAEEASYQLGTLGPIGLNALVNALYSDDSWTARWAASNIGRIGTDQAIKVLERAIRERLHLREIGPSCVRFNAIEAIGNSANPVGARVLCDVMLDSDDDQAAEAFDAIHKMMEQSSKTVPTDVLVDLMRTRNIQRYRPHTYLLGVSELHQMAKSELDRRRNKSIAKKA